MRRQVGRWRRHVTCAHVACRAGRRVTMAETAGHAMLAATGRQRWAVRRQWEVVVAVQAAMMMR